MTTPWYSLNESQGFKWSWNNTRAHSGIDLATDPGRPITVPTESVMISHGVEPWGGQINILYNNTNGHPEILTWLHTEDETPIAPGTILHAGDLLGHSGTPPPGYGNGPHIHFERTLGNIPPYMGYNPWYPQAHNYPYTPQPVLDELNHTGNPLTWPMPLANTIQNPLTNPVNDIGGAIGSAVADVENKAADALKRAGVFAIGALLAIVGLYVIFKPQVDQLAQSTQSKLGEFANNVGNAAGAAGKAAGSGAATGGATGGAGALAEDALVAA